MPLISRFDPWRSPLCTCPPKLTFNPYSGCDHGCLYCYATSYTRLDFASCTPKRDLARRLEGEASKLEGEVISISLSSDPYPTVEAENRLTRTSLEILSRHNCKIHVITKSSLVTRDKDLLRRVPSAVSVTVTTEDEEIARIIEPHADPPSERLRAVKELIQDGLPTTVRIDPVIPFVNDDPQRLVKALAEIGVRHITSSTYKAKRDNWRRLSAAMPEVADKLRSLYFEKGEKIGGNIYLPASLRSQLMGKLRALADKKGVRFGTCREGLSHLNTGVCDGSWVIQEGSRGIL